MNKVVDMTTKVLDQYVEDNLLRSVDHPDLPLRLYTYTRHCQYERKWDEITINARSLVMDVEEDKVVSQSMWKFFNLGEMPQDLTPEFSTYEKVDGCLINIFEYKGELVVTSRGSFTSDHSNQAREIIKGKEKQLLKLCKEGYTLCFELIHPDFKIILDYGDTQNLFYLWSVNQKNWNLERHPILGFPSAKEVDSGLTPKELKNQNIRGKEGYVLRFDNGTMIKVKFEDYTEMARIAQNINLKEVWRAFYSQVVEGDINHLDMLIDQCPDEFYDWLRDSIISLRLSYDAYRDLVRSMNDFCLTLAKNEMKSKDMLEGADEDTVRKYFAKVVTDKFPNYSGMIFLQYDDRKNKLAKAVVKEIEPSPDRAQYHTIKAE